MADLSIGFATFVMEDPATGVAPSWQTTKAAALPYLANLYRVHAETDRRRSAESIQSAASASGISRSR